MSYRVRHNAEQRHKSARFNRRLKRMEPTEELQDGTVTAIVCKDGTRRMVGKTGTEQAFSESRREGKVALVSVLVPKSAGERGRHQVEAVMGGMNLTRDLQMEEFIGYPEAARAYARHGVDACEKTMAAKIGAMQAG